MEREKIPIEVQEKFAQLDHIQPEKLLYTVEGAAQKLSLGRTFVYELMMREKLFSIKLGGRRLIPYFALVDFVAEQVARSKEGRDE